MTARRFFFTRPRVFVFEQTLASGPINYNLKSAAIAAGWDQVLPLDARISVTSRVGANNTSTPAFQTGSTFPAGSILQLTISAAGSIIGMGGAGGDGSGGGIDGKPGGTGLQASAPITITNNGIIAGGGGGGGCSIHDNYGDIYQRQAAGGNGGSSNVNWSAGGSGTWAGASGQNAYTGAWATAANANTTTDSTTIYGGNGGVWGASGGVGFNGNAFNGNGGSGGNAVVGNSNITWLATGTRYGAIT